MESKIAKALKMKLNPVAIIFSNKKPENALQFKEGKWGCVMWLFASAAKGKTAVFDRNTYGCWGGAVGLGFGNKYLEFLGGIDCFYYFLSSGNKNWDKGKAIAENIKPFVTKEFYEDFLEGERYLKSPELVKKFVEKLPITEVPAEYVIFKPLKEVILKEERPIVIVFPVNSHQLSALVFLANYERENFENVIVPWGAGCQTIGIFAYKEANSDLPKAVLGLTDPSARKQVRKYLGDNIFTFTLPFNFFNELEQNVEGSFLERSTWQALSDKDNNTSKTAKHTEKLDNKQDVTN
ncbi:MAG: DUF169 domain-containing protein [Thermodesulfovibrio sp.]|nr:DUF169 domain-containing protein [Thermodesulfovibrio sp.]MCX7724425.1 DUF169 domain-containing protein [Thermodesulfovibrio sp.]MDW7972202.1 DUF169 domain-containing protein [Thermodesulfovibrio sp.]